MQLEHNDQAPTDDDYDDGQRVQVLFQAVVVKEHISNDTLQLNLGLGDIINVLELDSSGWSGGYKVGDDKNTGWFPEHCYEKIQDESPPLKSSEPAAVAGPDADSQHCSGNTTTNLETDALCTNPIDPKPINSDATEVPSAHARQEELSQLWRKIELAEAGKRDAEGRCELLEVAKREAEVKCEAVERDSAHHRSQVQQLQTQVQQLQAQLQQVHSQLEHEQRKFDQVQLDAQNQQGQLQQQLQEQIEQEFQRQLDHQQQLHQQQLQEQKELQKQMQQQMEQQVQEYKDQVQQLKGQERHQTVCKAQPEPRSASVRSLADLSTASLNTHSVREREEPEMIHPKPSDVTPKRPPLSTPPSDPVGARTFNFMTPESNDARMASNPNLVREGRSADAFCGMGAGDTDTSEAPRPGSVRERIRELERQQQEKRQSSRGPCPHRTSHSAHSRRSIPLQSSRHPASMPRVSAPVGQMALRSLQMDMAAALADGPEELRPQSITFGMVPLQALSKASPQR